MENYQEEDYRKNLTRFTYDKTAFQGWRLCISRGRKTMVKYFSDKRYGDSAKALHAAEDTLKKLRLIFNASKAANDGRIDEAAVRLAQAVLDGLKREDVEHRKTERNRKFRMKEEAKRKRASERKARLSSTRKRLYARRKTTRLTPELEKNSPSNEVLEA